MDRENAPPSTPYFVIVTPLYGWDEDDVFLQYRQIEFAKSVTKKKIVAEIEKAVDFQGQVEVAELIAEYTLPITPSKEIVS